MAVRVRTVRSLEEFGPALGAIGHYFGWQPAGEDLERFNSFLPLDRMHAVFDGGRVVAGALPFEMTVPGGPVPCGGVTVVGVLPSHRRRGLLRRMMVEQLDMIREREEPIAALWASEDTIYGRYGYGQASSRLDIKVPRAWGQLRGDLPSRQGRVRLVDHEEAIRTFPRIHDRVRRRMPGFISRSREWWEGRLLLDIPERRFG